MPEIADLAPPSFQRLIGLYDRGRPGPTVVVVAGIHGNEPAGPRAVTRVLDELRAGDVPMRGRVVALAGNVRALRAGQRYEVRDLNRGWTAEGIEAAVGHPGCSEDHEQAELLDALSRHLDRGEERGIVIDLHSSSAPGPPFAVLGDTLRNRPIAFALGVPVILGLEELLQGTLIEFLVEHGHVAIAVEGGQHDAPETAAHLASALWLALEAGGAVDAADVPMRDAKARVLREAARFAPGVVEVRYRHAIEPDDRFRMEPGFVNFDVVRAGQPLARDLRGVVFSPEDGRLLLPLYQGKGDDGFFIGRPVRRGWLGLSAAMRSLRIDRLAVFMPGVRRDPDHPDHLLVDPGVARWFTLEVFHLLGYRREAYKAGYLHFSRRRPDHLPIRPLRGRE